MNEKKWQSLGRLLEEMGFEQMNEKKWQSLGRLLEEMGFEHWLENHFTEVVKLEVQSPRFGLEVAQIIRRHFPSVRCDLYITRSVP